MVEIIARYNYCFFFYNPGYPGQFTLTTTNLRVHWISCKPNGHVRHREDDRYVQKGSNLDTKKGNKSLPPRDHDLKYTIVIVFREREREKGMLRGKRGANYCSTSMGWHWAGRSLMIEINLLVRSIDL